MKKIILLLIISISTLPSFAQTTNYYESLFLDVSGIDVSSGYDDSGFISIANTSNQLTYYWNVSARMEALLLMYESTNDTQYLQTFLKFANKAINRRDDNRTSLPGASLTAITTYHDTENANPTWSTRRYNSACPRLNGFDINGNGVIEEGNERNWHIDSNLRYLRAPHTSDPCPVDICIEIPHLAGNANIIYSFVKFYNIINGAPFSVQGTTFPNYGQTENVSITFNDAADDLLDAAKETFDYFERLWDDSDGAYREHLEGPEELTVPLKFKGARFPLNMQCAMGRVLVQFYLTSTNNAFYDDRIDKLATHIKNHTSIVIGAKQWTYWGYPDPLANALALGLPAGAPNSEYPDDTRSDNPLREDISHSALTVTFPYECFNAGLTSAFTAVDIDQYANTLLKDIYIDVLQLRDGVMNNNDPGVNTNSNWNFKNNTNTHPLESGFPDTTAPGAYLYSHWMMYAQTEPKIYQMLNDFNTSNFYPTLSSGDNFSGNLDFPLSIAYLCANQSLFAPIASEHGWGTASNWTGVAGGNFDADNEEEFVYLKKSDGAFRIGEINSSHDINNIAWSTSYGTNFEWRNIATGNFDSDAEDEIVAVSNEPGQIGFYVFDVLGNSINQIGVSTTFGPSSDCVDAAAGDFVTGGKDDFVIARNFNLQLFLYSHNNSGTRTYETVTSLLSLETNSGTLLTPAIPSDAKIIGISSGNIIDGLPGDELVVLVNSTDNLTNGYFVLSLNQTTKRFEVVEQNTGWGTAHNWQALTVGDYNGDGKDDILMHGDLESNYKVYYVIENTDGSYSRGSLGLESFDSSQIHGNILGSGNFDASSANDELIVLRNTDAGILVYAYTEMVSSTASRPTNSGTDVFIDNFNQTDEVKIYPNPTTGIVSIHVTKEISDIRINNILGERIDVKTKNKTFDISSFPKGVYLLNIEFTNGKIITKKIIKN